jgi:hypothetical protein
MDDWGDRVAFAIPAFVLVVLITVVIWPELQNLDWAKTLESSEHLFTVLGIIIGGFWAYYGFIKGRVYMPRLEPKIIGEIIYIEGICCLSVGLELKNVGASKVPILKSSGLDIFSDQTYRLPRRDGERLEFESIP